VHTTVVQDGEVLVLVAVALDKKDRNHQTALQLLVAVALAETVSLQVLLVVLFIVQAVEAVAVVITQALLVQAVSVAEAQEVWAEVQLQVLQTLAVAAVVVMLMRRLAEAVFVLSDI
jgi:hypothetical protein